jgi:excisionase family DNA binding protein
MPSETPTVQKLMFSRKESATVLAISCRSIDKMVASGKLPHRRFGRKVVIPFDALLKFSQKDHDSLD